MKFWYHAIAAVVGLAVAALIVYLVFGSASEQGAVQDGDAGALASTDDLCGTIDVADTTSQDAREQAAENLPALFDDLGPIPAIREDKVEQKDWVARVHAASGGCIDEMTITTPGTTISMTVGDSVSSDQAAAYAAGVLAQAFTPPFNPRKVTLVTTVEDSERTIVVSNRAWRAYQAARKQLKREHTVANLKLFKQATGQQYGGDLRVVGW